MESDKTSAYLFFKKFVDDPDYLAILKSRLNAGILSPMLEKRIWEYVYGRPIEKVEVDDMRAGRYADMDEVALAERARELSELAAMLGGLAGPPSPKKDKKVVN